MAIPITREEYERKFGTAPTAPQSTKPQEQGGNFASGFAKSALNTVKGLGQLGEGTAKILTPKPLEKYLPNKWSEESLKRSAEGDSAGEKVIGKLFSEETLQTKPGEGVGRFVGDVAQYAIPGSKVAKLTKGLPTVARIGAQALSSGTVAATQSGKVGKESAIAAGVEAVAPGAGKIAGKVLQPVGRFLTRILEGTGSALSGASMRQIEQLVKNPKLAKSMLGQDAREVLKRDAETVMNGVFNIRQQARNAYGKGLEQLAKEDINPRLLRDKLNLVIKKFGIGVKDGDITLSKVEFDDPKNIEKARELIMRINGQQDLSGTGVRKLLDDIENTAFRVANSDERLSFNAFVKDLAGAVKDGINASTPKLKAIDAKFSGDMQLVEAIEDIFGRVQYKNSAELLKISKSLDALFNKKGLTPEYVDEFISRISKQPEAFKTSEAVRQIGELEQASNTVGTNVFEIVRTFTSAVVSPETVRNIAIYTGLGVDFVQEMATKLSPATRGAIIRAIIGDTNQNVENK